MFFVLADSRTRPPARNGPGRKRGRRPTPKSPQGFDSGRSVSDHAANSTLGALSIPTEWSAEVRRAVSRLPREIDGDRFPERRDLRQLPLITIDGETSRDFDDAVFAEIWSPQPGSARGHPSQEKEPQPGSARGHASQEKEPQPGSARGHASQEKEPQPGSARGHASQEESPQPGSARGHPPHSGWRLVVAIADVGHYVKAGSALDDAAFTRGTSVYLPDRVIPMLPEALSNNLCSLRPGEARLALVCEMQVDRSGEVTACSFHEAVIRSWERMTYTQISAFLNGEDLGLEVPVVHSIRALEEAFQALRRARERRGALDFDTPESRLSLENGAVTAITPMVRNDAHRLIEEAMIAANVCAARFLEGHEKQALYRVHEAPEREKAEQLASAFAACGVRWSPQDRTPAALQRALLAIGERDVGERDEKWLFEMLVLRAMQQANYRPGPRGHFGLALTRYMHFTSPIRRYPDLVVHRAIKRVLHRKAGQIAPPDWLVAAGEQSSMTERRAEDASRRVDAWLKCEFLAERVGETFASMVAGVTDFGLFVDLKGYYIQGLVHVSELGTDYFHYRPGSMSLVGESSGARFTLGDELEVRLTEVQPELGRLNLVPANSRRRRRGGGRGRGPGRRR